MNEAADVVADDLVEDFVDHLHVRLAADVIAELGLYHRENGFNIAALVVATLKAIGTDVVRLETV